MEILHKTMGINSTSHPMTINIKKKFKINTICIFKSINYLLTKHYYHEEKN